MRNDTEQSHTLIILVGWLGCKEKNLNRFENAYRSLGYDVVTKIPPPPMVCLASLYPPQSLERKVPFSRYTMDDMAYQIVEEFQHTEYSHLILHVFSNTGSFLWESIRQIINRPLAASSIYMKEKLIGIIFDSGPCDYSKDRDRRLLDGALDFCSQEDRVQLRQFLKKNDGSEMELQIRQRAKDFWAGMKHCTLPIPQLYILSKDDKLTPFEALSELIQYRETRMDENMIQKYAIESSPHCRHFLTDENKYMESIRLLLNNAYSCRDGKIVRSNL